MLLSNAPEGGNLHVCATRMCVRRACDAHAAYTRASMHARAHARTCACGVHAVVFARVVHEEEDRLLRRQRDPLAQHVDKLADLRTAQSPLKSRPGVAARGGSCDWATAWGYGPAQTVMSIGMRYFDLTGRNTKARQNISACARGRCARAAGAGLALGTCPGRACRRRASSRRSRARGRYIARAHGPTRRRAAQRSAHACARSSSASCCWMDPMALQPRRLAEFRQWVGEGHGHNRPALFFFHC